MAKARAKKQRVDTAKGAVTTMQGAVTAIPPPAWVRLPDEALPFWTSITQARASDRWNDSDLEMAAELARTKARIEALNIRIDSDGDMLTNERGVLCVNPLHPLLETLTRRMIALARALQVHAEATQGKSREQVASSQAQSKARETVEKLGGDELIPGLH